MRDQALKADDRRKATRYRLEFPVIFKWHDGEMHTDGGFTRDVSSKALFVISTDAPPVKTSLQLQIILPASVNVLGNAVKTTGEVLRLSTEREGHGFAVRAKLYTHHGTTKLYIQ